MSEQIAQIRDPDLVGGRRQLWASTVQLGERRLEDRRPGQGLERGGEQGGQSSGSPVANRRG